MKRDTAELLAAYVDGVGELTPSERRRVELLLASDKAARDDESATRDLIGKLRALPPQGEPDWTALERSIQEAAKEMDRPRRSAWLTFGGGEVVPRPWYRRFWFTIPAGLALAGGAAVLVFALRGGSTTETESPVVVHAPAPVEQPPVETDGPVAVYLDGTELELAVESSNLAEDRLDEMTFAGLETFDVADNLLGEDFGWIDDLDDDALRRLEGLIEKQNKGT